MTGNTVYDHSGTGIYDDAGEVGGTAVTGNLVYGNTTGINMQQETNAPPVLSTVSNNVVRNNVSTGIYAFADVLVSGNTVYGQSASGAVGIYSSYSESGGIANNVIYTNYVGIETDYTGDTIRNNRLYNNSYAAIEAEGNLPVLANDVYSNNIGILLGYNFNGRVDDNLVYANTTDGILIESYSSGSEFVNNTVYQPQGDAVDIEGGSENIHLLNNILDVLDGYAVSVASNSESGFTSNYNDLVITGTDPNARIGNWGGTIADTLSAWQQASGADPDSISADPKFVDPAGADGILGYALVNGAYHDGGADDNFSLSGDSPCTNRGYSWGIPATDITGASRSYDDPGTLNQGSDDYFASSTSQSIYTSGALGTPQGWRGSDTYYTLTLPFAFTFYGVSYTAVEVSTSGFLQFAGSDYAGNNAPTASQLLNDARIAPLWLNMNTEGPGNDIYVNTSVSGQVSIRWLGTNTADGSQVDFAVVLFSNGSIRFDYGHGNTNVGSAIIGISAGNGDNYQIAGYTGISSLSNATSILYTLQPGFADIGAYEFLGNSLDTTPPTVTNVSPSVIATSGVAVTSFNQIQLTFSEPLDAIDANAAAVYQLVQQVTSETAYSLAPQYTPGSTTVTLSIDAPGGGDLPDGSYQLTVFGEALHDLSGLELAGNGTAAGTNFVRTFSVVTSANWSGGGSSGLWSNAANWGGTAPPADVPLVFGSSEGGTTTNDLPGGMQFTSITFPANAGPFVLDGNTIDLSGNIVNNSSAIETVNLPLMLIGGSHTLNAVSGNLTIGGPISESGGANSIVKTGTGSVILSGANSYSGGTIVSGGTLIVTNASALPAGSSLTVGAGGTFIFDPTAIASGAVPAAQATTKSNSAASAARTVAAAATMRVETRESVGRIASLPYSPRQIGNLSYEGTANLHYNGAAKESPANGDVNLAAVAVALQRAFTKAAAADWDWFAPAAWDPSQQGQSNWQARALAATDLVLASYGH
ncbi:MAG: right-handed parallel beta-helix repeat-containing protein [Thermoguttaceae bacterium]